MKNSAELKSLNEIAAMIDELAQKIRAKKSDLPTIGYSSDFAYPFIEINENGYNYVVMERGQELRREVTRKTDELMFLVFQDTTYSMAIRGVRNEIEQTGDQRRTYFSRQVELLEKLSSEWGAVVRRKQAEILKNNPFDDFASKRADYCKELRDSGMSDEDAWKVACEKYPLVGEV